MISNTQVNFTALKNFATPQEIRLLAKHRARRKYVIGLRSSTIEGLGFGVSEGYFVMLKLSLAFSSLETLASVISRKGNLGIRNENFVSDLNSGKLDKLLIAMDKDHVRRYTGSEPDLIKKWKGIPLDSDLTKIVYQCRNYMFHGSFTPSETGLASSARLRVSVLGLAMSTLQAGDEALEKWAKKRIKP